MLGAIVGDIVGSRFEWNSIKTKEFDLFTESSKFTDDSVMTLAIASALLKAKDDYSRLSEIAIKQMRLVGRMYPYCGYGGMFKHWLFSDDLGPYNSFGNGAAMRVSACAFAAQSLAQVKELSCMVTEVTHNHSAGIRGAEATAVSIFLAREGRSIGEIKDYIDKNYYSLDFTLNEIRDSYKFDATCQNTVPQAVIAFLESTSYEDTLRNAVSLGGDSDTLAAIAGAIAGAYYGIPEDIQKKALTYLDERLYRIWSEFTAVFI
ncbi:MAG: ADP-ribosylglycohydrolase family protein [Firmicutes bacterium]|nr:ADP-ribosylglycohydrolase family protein [Bacillota bacterium]